MDQLRQRQRALRVAMQRIGDESAHIVEAKRCQRDLVDPRTGSANRLQRAHERVRGTDLVVPVGADHQ